MKIKDIEVGKVYGSRVRADYSTPDKLRVVAVRVQELQRWERGLSTWYREGGNRVAVEVLGRDDKVIRREVYGPAAIDGPYDEVMAEHERMRAAQREHRAKVEKARANNVGEATRLANGILAACHLRARPLYPSGDGTVTFELRELRALYEAVVGDPAQEA